MDTVVPKRWGAVLYAASQTMTRYFQFWKSSLNDEELKDALDGHSDGPKDEWLRKVWKSRGSPNEEARARELVRLKKTEEENANVEKLERASGGHEEALRRALRADPTFAAEYIKAAMEDTEEPAVLLIALRHVSEAYGMAEVAKAAGVEQEDLEYALSPKGNPTLKTLTAVLKAVGLRPAVAPGTSGQQPACAC